MPAGVRGGELADLVGRVQRGVEPVEAICFHPERDVAVMEMCRNLYLVEVAH